MYKNVFILNLFIVIITYMESEHFTGEVWHFKTIHLIETWEWRTLLEDTKQFPKRPSLASFTSSDIFIEHNQKEIKDETISFKRSTPEKTQNSYLKNVIYDVSVHNAIKLFNLSIE